MHSQSTTTLAFGHLCLVSASCLYRLLSLSTSLLSIHDLGIVLRHFSQQALRNAVGFISSAEILGAPSQLVSSVAAGTRSLAQVRC